MPFRCDGLPVLACLLGSLLGTGAAQGAPLGSAFTYQGQLRESGLPANGLYDLQVCLFDGPVNPVTLACAPDFADVPVEVGLFTLSLDFGTAPFAGEVRYLELRVRPGASSGGYTILSPRQAIRPAPEALRAAASSAAPWSGLSGVPAGFADGVDDNSGGTVTSVAAGTGLSGGTITASGTIAIANGGVGTAQIAENAVDGVRILDGSIAAADLSPDSVGAAQVAGNAVDTAAIVDASVTTPKIADGAVVGPKVAAGAIGAVQIDPTQVQVRIGGACILGTYLRGINADGSVLCSDLPGVSTTTTVGFPGSGGVGDYNAIAVGSDGLPVISFWESSGILHVAKCANAACSGLATDTPVDDPLVNSVGSFTSIAIGTDGLPVISYRDQTAATLKVAKCANPSCTGAATITTVDDPPTNGVGLFTSIAIGSDGFPVISYYDETALALKVAKCANAACIGLATITTVDDSANDLGRYSSIAIGSDGLPVVSYRDNTAGTLKVAKCATATCTGAATITTIDDSVVNSGTYTSIAIGADGLPVISYYGNSAGALMVAKCLNAACTGATIVTPVDDPTNSVGANTSITIGADGLPVISYRDVPANALKVAKCADAACSGVATITTLADLADAPNLATSIAIGSDGLPVISYQNMSVGRLEVLKCGTRICR